MYTVLYKVYVSSTRSRICTQYSIQYMHTVRYTVYVYSTYTVSVYTKAYTKVWGRLWDLFLIGPLPLLGGWGQHGQSPWQAICVLKFESSYMLQKKWTASPPLLGAAAGCCCCLGAAAVYIQYMYSVDMLYIYSTCKQ